MRTVWGITWRCVLSPLLLLAFILWVTGEITFGNGGKR